MPSNQLVAPPGAFRSRRESGRERETKWTCVDEVCVFGLRCPTWLTRRRRGRCAGGPDAECDKKCANGGWCNHDKICQCPEGYMGQHCRTALCYPQCMNGGSCTSPGMCSCPSGFQGRHCEGGRFRSFFSNFFSFSSTQFHPGVTQLLSWHSSSMDLAHKLSTASAFLQRWVLNQKKITGGTRLELALGEMALLMTPTRRQLHVPQNMRDRLIAIECQD